MGDELCYLDAHKVEGPAGTLANLELCSGDNERLGTVEGVIIEPARRRVRFYVVNDGRWLHRSRYLLPVEHAARLDLDGAVLRIDSPASAISRQAIDLRRIRRFSDDDVVTAMFAPTPA